MNGQVQGLQELSGQAESEHSIYRSHLLHELLGVPVNNRSRAKVS